MVVEKQKAAAADPSNSCVSGIGNDYFPLPSWLDEIPVGADLLGLDQLSVVGDVRRPNGSLEDKKILSFGVRVVVLALPTTWRDRPLLEERKQAGADPGCLFRRRALSGFDPAGRRIRL